MKRMGERIKKQREKISMPLSELASKVGVSPSCLSQIENIKAFPSIFTLKKIADTLNTTVGSLVGENENLATNPLLKNSEKKFVEKLGRHADLYLLSHHDLNKQMEAFFLIIEQDGLVDTLMEKHPGQTFIYLLKGRLEITLNDEKYTMEKGSSFYIKQKGSLIIKNISAHTCEALCINTHPNH